MSSFIRVGVHMDAVRAISTSAYEWAGAGVAHRFLMAGPYSASTPACAWKYLRLTKLFSKLFSKPKKAVMPSVAET
jgi:hypothetical protein